MKKSYGALILAIFIGIHFCSCSSIEPTVAGEINMPDDTYKVSNNIGEIIKHAKGVFYFNDSFTPSGGSRRVFTTALNDTILDLGSHDGSAFTAPFVMDTEYDQVLIMFETWPGSGNLSRQSFYRITNDRLMPILTKDQGSFLNEAKINTQIKDSLYTMKGEIYNGFGYGPEIISPKGGISFSKTVYNATNPELNIGREGYAWLSGVYRFVIENEKMIIVAKELTINLNE